MDASRRIGVVENVDCERIHVCPFFKGELQVKPETLALFKARYCRGQSAECARYLVFVALGADAVPRDLSPQDHLRAMAIVRTVHNEHVRQQREHSVVGSD